MNSTVQNKTFGIFTENSFYEKVRISPAWLGIFNDTNVKRNYLAEFKVCMKAANQHCKLLRVTKVANIIIDKYYKNFQLRLVVI